VVIVVGGVDVGGGDTRRQRCSDCAMLFDEIGNAFRLVDVGFAPLMLYFGPSLTFDLHILVKANPFLNLYCLSRLCYAHSGVLVGRNLHMRIVALQTARLLGQQLDLESYSVEKVLGEIAVTVDDTLVIMCERSETVVNVGALTKMCEIEADFPLFSSNTLSE